MDHLPWGETVMDHYLARCQKKVQHFSSQSCLCLLSGCVITTAMLLHELPTMVTGAYQIPCANVQIRTGHGRALIAKTVLHFLTSKKPLESTWGETWELKAAKPLWTRRIDFKDELIYTQLFTSGMLMWGCSCSARQECWRWPSCLWCDVPHWGAVYHFICLQMLSLLCSVMLFSQRCVLCSLFTKADKHTVH